MELIKSAKDQPMSQHQNGFTATQTQQQPNERETPMKNVLTPSDLFVTPSSVQDLQDRVNSFTGGERVAANMAMMMTWNLCSKLVGEAIAAEMPKVGVSIAVVDYDAVWKTFHVNCTGAVTQSFAMPAFIMAKIDPEQRFLEDLNDYVGLTISV